MSAITFFINRKTVNLLLIELKHCFTIGCISNCGHQVKHSKEFIILTLQCYLSSQRMCCLGNRHGLQMVEVISSYVSGQVDK